MAASPHDSNLERDLQVSAIFREGADSMQSEKAVVSDSSVVSQVKSLTLMRHRLKRPGGLDEIMNLGDRKATRSGTGWERSQRDASEQDHGWRPRSEPQDPTGQDIPTSPQEMGPTGPAWTVTATWLFVGLGIVIRLVRYLVDYPIWHDEAFLAANFWDRDYVNLLRPWTTVRWPRGCSWRSSGRP